MVALMVAYGLDEAGTADGAQATTTPDETVEGFVTEFAAAIASGNEEFVVARLHPVFVAAYGEELCQTWIAREIMGLASYDLVSLDGGPRSQPYAFLAGEGTIDDVFDATVSFTYRGELLTNPTNFALVDGKMHWLGQCR